jgi:hypothetical protein
MFSVLRFHQLLWSVRLHLCSARTFRLPALWAAGELLSAPCLLHFRLSPGADHRAFSAGSRDTTAMSFSAAAGCPQSMTSSGERSLPALFAGESDMEITDASSSVLSLPRRGGSGTAQCDAAGIRAVDIGIRPVHRCVRTISVLLLRRHAAVLGDDVRAGRVRSEPPRFIA